MTIFVKMLQIMKNIKILFGILILAISFSCTKSDNHESAKTLSAKINGVNKFFKEINVVEEVYPDYTDYTITAKQSDDSTKEIKILMEKGATGNESIFYIQYFNGTDYFDNSASNINTTISENSATKLSGTFSADLDNGNGTIVQITQGMININF